MHARFAGNRRPDEAQLRYVRGVDLIERTIPPAVIGAANHQPIAVGRVFQTLNSDGRIILQNEGNGRWSGPFPFLSVVGRAELCAINKPTLIPSAVARPLLIIFLNAIFLNAEARTYTPQGKRTIPSKDHLKCDLNEPWRGGTDNAAEGCAVDVAVHRTRSVKLRVVENVESLQAQFY